jgi:uncharacterized phiE125 gp8 family phage protein
MQQHYSYRYGLRVKTPATAEPLTLTEARAHSRFDSFAEDGVIASYILAAREYIENLSGRTLCPTTFVMSLDAFPCTNWLDLPREPVQSITAITYTNGTGGTSTWSSAAWELDVYSTPARLRPKDGYDWPTDVADALGAVEIEFIAGYAGPEAIPQPIMQALRMLVGYYLENREAVMLNDTPRDMPWSVIPLLTPYRNPPV